MPFSRRRTVPRFLSPHPEHQFRSIFPNRMNLPRSNAFTVNSLAGSFFPLSAKVSQSGPVASLFVCAQCVVDLCDLIVQHAQENLVLFAVGQASQFDERTQEELSIAQLAAQAALPFTAIDTATILLKKVNLYPLLSTIAHYNLCLFDLADGWDEAQVIGQVLAYREHDWRGAEPLLPKMPGSRLYLTSHDDCYLTVESYSPLVSRAILIRTLQIFAGAFLAKKKKFRSELSELSPDLLDVFWKDDFGITILDKTTLLRDDCLRMGVSPKPYNFRDAADYPPEFWIVYDLQAQSWQVQP
jgi:hypothetical protein